MLRKHRKKDHITSSYVPREHKKTSCITQEHKKKTYDITSILNEHKKWKEKKKIEER